MSREEHDEEELERNKQAENEDGLRVENFEKEMNKEITTEGSKMDSVSYSDGPRGRSFLEGCSVQKIL